MTLNEALGLVDVSGGSGYYHFKVETNDEKELKEAYSVLKKNYDRRVNNIKKDERFDILPKTYNDFQERARRQNLLVGDKLKTASQLDVSELKKGVKNLFSIFKTVENKTQKEGSVKEYSKKLKSVEKNLNLQGYASAKESERIAFWEYRKQIMFDNNEAFYGYSSGDSIQATYNIYQSSEDKIDNIILNERLSDKLVDYGFPLDPNQWSADDKYLIDRLKQELLDEISEMNKFQKNLEAVKITANDLEAQRLLRNQAAVRNFMRRG